MVQDINHKVASLDIGSQVRALRNQRDLTLQDLAELTGLSKPNLSQIENNLVTPPIATLLKIATALGVAIGYFFRESSKPLNVVVTRKDDRSGVAKGPHISHIGYTYEPLAYMKINKNMEPFVVEMEERKASEIVFNNHRGEEFLFVLDGQLEFRCGDDIIILDEGDSIYFDADIPHGYRGLSGSAKALAVIFRP